jgi:hypothetical protein
MTRYAIVRWFTEAMSSITARRGPCRSPGTQRGASYLLTVWPWLGTPRSTTRCTTGWWCFGGRIYGYYAQHDIWALIYPGAPNGRYSLLAAVPQTRAWHAAIYDPIRAQMVIYGGNNFTKPDGRHVDGHMDALLDGRARVDGNEAQPSPRNSHSAIYDPLRDRMLLFSGGAERHVNDPRDDLPVLSLSGKPKVGSFECGGIRPKYSRIMPRSMIHPMTAWWFSRVLHRGVATFSIGTPAWAPVTPSGTPPSSLGPVVYDSLRDRALVFSGGVFALSLSGPPVWSELSTSGTPAAVTLRSTIQCATESCSLARLLFRSFLSRDRRHGQRSLLRGRRPLIAWARRSTIRSAIAS